jgi:hypothetical protein
MIPMCEIVASIPLAVNENLIIPDSAKLNPPSTVQNSVDMLK